MASSAREAKLDSTWHLDTDHFPVTMVCQCCFKKPRGEEKREVTKYKDAETYTNKAEMNAYFKDSMSEEDALRYEK